MKVFKLGELPSHIDERGGIYSIMPEGTEIKSATYITGHKGAIRGNHYHKTDFHYCCVIGGTILYTSKNRHTGLVEEVTLEAGDCVVNEGDELHRFTFLTHGSFMCVAKNSRTEENYEEDTVRENF